MDHWMKSIKMEQATSSSTSSSMPHHPPNVRQLWRAWISNSSGTPSMPHHPPNVCQPWRNWISNSSECPCHITFQISPSNVRQLWRVWISKFKWDAPSNAPLLLLNFSLWILNSSETPTLSMLVTFPFEFKFKWGAHQILPFFMFIWIWMKGLGSL